MMLHNKSKLGSILVSQGLITEDQLNIALTKQNVLGERLAKILVDLGYIEEDKLLHILAKQLNIPFINLQNYSLNSNVAVLLPEFYACRYHALVLNQSDDGLLIGMVDPQDVIAYDELCRVLNKPLSFALIREADFLHAIDIIYRHTVEISSFAEKLSEELKQYDYDLEKLSAGLSSSDAPVVRLLQSVFDDAVQMNASDIHIEPDEKVLRIRQRIDGVLHEQVLKENSIATALALRLKLMAGLNIAEKRLPQDGRFSIRIKNKNFDIRLSTIPTQFGESVVMRLLDQSGTLLNLNNAGMPTAILESFRHVCSLPYGLILVVGPTGSGKTTTLYGTLSELNEPDVKIITVEDPVEYRLPRINQVQVQPKIELTFARILRTILRQDPDIIMVGELRDEETVAIALRAALTGHLVLGTVHSNNAVTTPIRLLDMKAPGYLVASVLRAVLSQRLVRRNCIRCIGNYEPTKQELTWLENFKDKLPEKITFKRGHGCSYCHQTGYHGRVGVYEYLEMNPNLAEALRDNNTAEFNKLAYTSKNFRPLVLEGLDLVAKGVTTLSEAIGIIGDDYADF